MTFLPAIGPRLAAQLGHAPEWDVPVLLCDGCGVAEKALTKRGLLRAWARETGVPPRWLREDWQGCVLHYCPRCAVGRRMEEL